MFVGNGVVKSFVNRIREKLLNFDFDGLFDTVEASHALTRCHSVDIGRHQNAVVQRLEAHLEMHCGAFRDANYGNAEGLLDASVD